MTPLFGWLNNRWQERSVCSGVSTPQRIAAKKRGAFGVISCPPTTKEATKKEAGVYHCPPHVFLGAVVVRFYLFIRLTNSSNVTHLFFGIIAAIQFFPRPFLFPPSFNRFSFIITGSSKK
jgi:hypothetical protein